MSEKTLFLAWQHGEQSGAWFPVGRLDADVSVPEYTFGYIRGVKTAEREIGFPPIFGFPRFDRRYISGRLFPLFQNRVMNRRRGDFREYLDTLDIEKPDPDPFEMLEVDGGYRVTDNFHVFPRIGGGENGAFRCRFFLHGWRQADEEAKRRVESLRAGENLRIGIAESGPKNGLAARIQAAQIQTEDGCAIGRPPSYLARALSEAPVHAAGDYRAHVVKVNSVWAPCAQRVLIELNGKWPQGYEPMSSEDFELIVPAGA